MQRIALGFALLFPFACLAQQAHFGQALEVGRQVLSETFGTPLCTPPAPQRELRHHLSELVEAIRAPGLSDATGMTPLDLAVLSDDPDAVRHVRALGDPLASRDGNPLHGAAQSSSPEMIRFLASLGVAPDGRTARGATPLMVAAAGNRLEAVRTLLSLGAHADAREEDGTTVLDYAMVCHDQAMIDLLLQSGAEVDDRARRLASRYGVRL